MEIVVVAIVFGAIVAVTAIISQTVVRLIGRPAQNRDAIENEPQLMQELYHGLTKLEERIEALETLLLDRDKHGNVS
jgi:phage shock protein B